MSNDKDTIVIVIPKTFGELTNIRVSELPGDGHQKKSKLDTCIICDRYSQCKNLKTKPHDCIIFCG